MAPAKPKQAELTVAESADGGLVVSVGHSGASVPIVSVPGNIVRHYVEDVEPATATTGGGNEEES